MSQADEILALLRDRGSRGASNFELMRISYQYPARLHTLRHKRGLTIENKHIKDKEWRITLIEEVPTPTVDPEEFLKDEPWTPEALSWIND